MSCENNSEQVKIDAGSAFALDEEELVDLLDDPDRWVPRILDPKDKSVEEEFLALIGQTKPERLVDVLVEAAARRYLRIDQSVTGILEPETASQ